MLTRREFAGIASCAICGITAFAAAQSSAQGAPPAATAGVTRKILSQTDGPAPGYVTLLVEATIEAGVAVGRHNAFQIPPETPHAGGKPGNAQSRILITYVVEKGKPLASPA